MKKLFTKEFKNSLAKYAENYYFVNKEKRIENPDFEICRKSDVDWKCNTCEYKDECSRGEEIQIDNKNIIQDLAREIIRCVEKREFRLKGSPLGENK